MAVTVTYTGVTPTIDADEDTWGQILNTDVFPKIKADLDAIASQYNVTQPLAVNAMPKAGGTFTGEVVIANVPPTSIRSAGFRGAPIRAVAANGNLLDTDPGVTLRLSAANNYTITIQPIGTTPLPVGTVVALRNASAANTLTIARGAGVELRVAGSPTNKDCALAAYGFASLLQEATNVWVISGTGVS